MLAKPNRLQGVRTIMVMGDLGTGGTQRQVLLLAQHLREYEGADVEVWAFGGEVGATARACEARNIPWRIVHLNWFTSRKDRKIRDVARFAGELRRAKADVILSYLMAPNVVCSLVWRLTGAKLCIWNQRCAGVDRLGARIERLAVSRTSKFISNSEAGADFLMNTLNAPGNKVHVVYNGVRKELPVKDRRTWRTDLVLDEEAFAACMIANLSIYKDHATLLRAWRLVVDEFESQGRECALLLAGRFDQSQHGLKALAFDLNLGKTVRFLGEVQDVAGLITACDLGILSSLAEGNSNAVLECMAHGLAVAGTDNPGMREALSTLNHEFLAAPRDAEGLADRILRLAFNPDVRDNVGTANRHRIEDRFDPQKNFAQTAAFIVEGLEENRVRRKPAST